MSKPVENTGSDESPPELKDKIPQVEDVQTRVKRACDAPLPVDFLLLTVENCEFLACYMQLSNPYRCWFDKLGYVYFDDVNKEGDQKEKVKVALLKCYAGSCGPGSSIISVAKAVSVLKPKAVISVGACSGLNTVETKLGDVVVCATLSGQSTGLRSCVGPRFLKVIKHSGFGWKPPLKESGARKVQVHCDGEFLSGPQEVRAKQRREELAESHPEAVAIEMEGEGLFAAAFDVQIEWLIVKGIADYADGDESVTKSWSSFASVMAASVVSHILRNPDVFRSWPHYTDPSESTSKGESPSSSTKDQTSIKCGDSSPPPEIRARGPAAERAFQKAMQNGKVKVYRGRIMLLGQDRAGKTSLKKSLLGMPFNPREESTVGVEVDPSKCEIEVDQVKNWEPTERKKLEVSEFVEDIARLIAKDLNETEAEEQAIGTADSPLKEAQDYSDEVDADSENPTRAESKSETSQNVVTAAVDTPSDSVAKEQSNTEHEIQLNIDTNATLPNDVTELVVRYLQSLKIEDHIKAREVILTLWDFAGQHLYYASHSVFLSERAVYVLVYNLSKNLMAEAEPCVRQGVDDILLDNPNSETNLDNLLSWLVSIHSIRATDGEVNRDFKNSQTKLCYLRPPVFIVGTNADHPVQPAKEMTKCIQKSIAGKTYKKHVIPPFFTVDNTKSHSDEGVKELRRKIMEVLEQEPYMGEEVPLRWFNFEKVVETLVAKKTYHMDLDQLQTVIRQVCRIDDQDEMAAMLNFYHDLGVIVKHGHTVVLQAQWLIDLFKKLITVRPFNEALPFYSDCWEELEENGILRMALIDHVFTDFIEKGLNKQDILEMMELYGLIAKFSCLSSENEDKRKYFVPAQLRSSPAGLCQIEPSSWDPCPLYVHFLDGFVPHGLFPQFLSRCIVWCSEHGLRQAPQLFNNGARLFIGSQTVFDLNLICKKRFIKVILKRSNPSSLEPPSPASTSQKIAVEVRNFIENTLEGLSRDLPWLRNFRHELSVACAFCAKHSEPCSKHDSVCCRHDDCLHLLQLRPGEELICPKNFSNEVIKLCGLERWLQVQKSQNEEQSADPSVPDGLDQPLSLKTGSPSPDDLLLVAYELGTSWKMLGRALRLPEALLEQIEEDERNLFEKCYSVLRHWTRAFGSDASYSCLARALQHPIVGRPRLAVKYCDAHSCVSPDEDVSARIH